MGEIADLWTRFYNLPGAFDPARDFSRLFADGDSFRIGELGANESMLVVIRSSSLFCKPSRLSSRC